MTNATHTVLYTGVTSDLQRRVAEHRMATEGSFTARYHVTVLVYYEVFNTPADAIRREKQIKAGSRAKKLQLISSMNPEWNDLA
jgi:putative endonuclease